MSKSSHITMPPFCDLVGMLRRVTKNTIAQAMMLLLEIYYEHGVLGPISWYPMKDGGGIHPGVATFPRLLFRPDAQS